MMRSKIKYNFFLYFFAYIDKKKINLKISPKIDKSLMKI